MLVAFTPFGGVVPRLDPLALPNGAAQTASNCRLTAGGILEAFKAPSSVFTGTGPFTTIYRYGQTTSSDTQYWFTSANTVDYVKGAIAGDTEERTYYTGDGAPKITKSNLALTSTPYPTASYRNGIPAPTNAPTGSITGTITDATAVADTRFYVYTHVSTLGEESAPSPVSAQFDIKPGQSVALTLSAVPSGSWVMTGKRIYRTSTGSSSTEFLFVAEVSAATTSYTDSVLAENLGEVCPTTTHALLPDAAKGLVGMPNGMMAAHTDYDVYFSVPYKPYAWPVGYMQTVDYPIVGLGVFGTTLVVLTKGFPYVMTGSDPQSISVEKLSVPYACLSKKSIVSALGGVVYAAADGLVLVDGSGPKVLTENLYTRREWNALSPATMVCGVWDEKILITYGTSNTLCLDGGTLTTLPFGALDFFTDPVTNSLFYSDATSTGTIYKFDAGAASTFTWKSRKVAVPHPHSFGYGQVIADTYPVTVSVYADGATIFSAVSVANDKPFRLPGTSRYRYWEMQITGSGKVFAAYLANSVSELQNV